MGSDVENTGLITHAALSEAAMFSRTRVSVGSGVERFVAAGKDASHPFPIKKTSLPCSSGNLCNKPTPTSQPKLPLPPQEVEGVMVTSLTQYVLALNTNMVVSLLLYLLKK